MNVPTKAILLAVMFCTNGVALWLAGKPAGFAVTYVAYSLAALGLFLAVFAKELSRRP